MLFRSRTLLSISIIALAAALDFAGSGSNAIVGGWEGSVVISQHIEDVLGQVDDVVTTGDNVVLDYKASHNATFDSLYSGPWSQKNGRYRVKLTKAVQLSIETMLPADATLKKVKYDLVNGQLLSNAHFTNTKFMIKVKQNGATGVQKALGAFGGVRQP